MTDFELDMTVMLATHDALRRDLALVAKLNVRNEGWIVFEQMLHAHHTAEDDVLWPAVRDAVQGRPDDLALVEQMEREHTAIPPALEALDRALVRGEEVSHAKSDLETRVLEHLTHEERDALPLVDRTFSDEQWMTLGQGMGQHVGADMPKFLPWVLEGADEDTTARVLAPMPPPVQQAYNNEWRPAFLALDRWATNVSVR